MVKFITCALVAMVSVSGCGTQQDPDIVLDLRALAVTAQPPEQVIDIDPQQPPTAEQLLAQLVPVEVCGLLANPGDPRPLRWSMTVCASDDNDRCSLDPLIVLGGGLIAEPTVALPQPKVCATLVPNFVLLAIVQKAIDNNQLAGLGGINVNIEFKFAIDEEFDSNPQYATKKIVLAPRQPAQRVANHNPTVQRWTAEIASAPKQPFTTAVEFPLGRCVDFTSSQRTPFSVSRGTQLRLTPVEPAGVREDYVVPTLTGGFRMFTENLTYQWLATTGSFTSGSSGGPRDAFGNQALLYTEWNAPADIKAAVDVSLWIVQRDERLGAAWFEACVRVVP
jgi:hypothetical protein